MRVHLILSGQKEVIPFNYQPILTGAFHKWLGRNKEHGEVSLYSFSWLNGKAVKEGLLINGYSKFFISSYDNSILQRVIKGIRTDNQITNNLNVCEIIIQDDPKFGNEAVFYCASPVFVKRMKDDREIHITWKDQDSDLCLTETLRRKLRKAGLSDDGVSVRFDRNYHSPKTKVIYYNKVGNRVNVCPVIVKGTPEQIAFAWNVGVGNSTGIGFGALK